MSSSNQQQILDKYDSGKKIKDIAKELELTVNYVRTVLIRAGIQIPSEKKGVDYYLDKYLTKWLIDAIYEKILMCSRTLGVSGIYSHKLDFKIGVDVIRMSFIKYLHGDTAISMKDEFDNIVATQLQEYKSSNLPPTEYLSQIEIVPIKTCMKMYFIYHDLIPTEDLYNDTEIRQAVLESNKDIHLLASTLNVNPRYIELLKQLVTVQDEVEIFKARLNLTDDALKMLDMKLDRKSINYIAKEFNVTSKVVRDTLYPICQEYVVLRKKKMYNYLLTNFNPLTSYMTNFMKTLYSKTYTEQLATIGSLIGLVDTYDIELYSHDYKLLTRYSKILNAHLTEDVDTLRAEIPEFLTLNSRIHPPSAIDKLFKTKVLEATVATIANQYSISLPSILPTVETSKVPQPIAI